MSLGLLGSGCAGLSYRVAIRTQPDGATTHVVRQAAGNEDISVQLPAQTPTEYEFNFAGGREVNYKVKLAKERYLDRETTFTRAFVDALPREGRVRVYVANLEDAPYQDIEKAEVEIDPKKGPVIAFRRVRAFREDIERQGVSPNKVVQLGDGSYVGGLSISQDGKRIAFAVVERAQDEQKNIVEFSTIRSVSTEGSGITQVTTGRWLDIDPGFSADGGYLYFSSNRLRHNGLDVLRLNSTSTGGGIAVIHRQNDGWSRYPSEAVNGLIAFSYLPQYAKASGDSHVWTLGGENQYPTQLREGTHPQVSPDGGTVVYIGPDHKLWTVSTKAQAPVQLTTNPETHESEPTWSPDGGCLVYISNEGKDSMGSPNNDVWIMRADGTQRRQLTTNGSDDVTPVVDPQRKWIYFVSNRGFKWGIWRMPWPEGMQ